MKNSLIIICLIGFNYVSLSQPIGGNEKILISNAVNDAIYLFRQDYYILDTTVTPAKKLGLNKQNYFGRFYFFAIRANGKFYASPDMKTPWDLDSNFSVAKEDKKYKPVLGASAFRKLKDSSFVPFDSLTFLIPGNDSTVQIVTGLSVIQARDSLQGLMLSKNGDGVIDSLCWYWSGKLPNRKSGTEKDDLFDYEIFRGRLTADSIPYNQKNFYYSNATMGGFILVAKAGSGQIHFLLSGLILKNKKGKFDFVNISAGDEKEERKISELEVDKETTDNKPKVKPKITEIENKN